MTQYIDKTVLVAEIERRIENCAKQREDMLNVQCHTLADDASARMGELRCIKEFLDTLEVKEVDLEKEYKDFVEEDPVYNKLVNGIVGKAIAKHFFELGLHYQSNSIDFGNVDDTLKEDGIDPDSKEGIKFKEYYYMALDAALKYFKPQKGE